MSSTRFIHRHTHGDSDSPELRPAWPEAAILQLRLVRIQSWSDLVSRHLVFLIYHRWVSRLWPRLPTCMS